LSNFTLYTKPIDRGRKGHNNRFRTKFNDFGQKRIPKIDTVQVAEAIDQDVKSIDMNFDFRNSICLEKESPVH
jgi:hypothetical protein